jgi:polar amino acid transport system substrate-binding protein
MKWICSYLLLSSLCLSQAYAAAPEIKLCYEDVSVFPWITGDDKGLVITELHIVEKMLNLRFKLIRLPWKRCQIEAQAGNLDGLIAASFNKDRAVWGVYPTDDDNTIEREYRLHTDSFFVFIRKDSNIKWENNHFENLGKNQVGVQLGYSVGSDLKDAGYPIHASFTTAHDILKELDFNAINVAVLQNHETTITLNEHPILKKNIVRLGQPFKIADQYLLFTRPFYTQNKELSRKIWHAIAQARKSKEYVKNEESLIGKTY